MSVAPWSVKGIDADTRETAKLAARRAGVTLGAWLNQTIRTASGDHPVDHRPAGNAGVPTDAAVPPCDPAAQAMFETIQKMSARIEELEDRLLQSPATLSERLDRLAGEVEAVNAEYNAARVPVERAIARLSARLQRLEADRPADTQAKKRFGIGRGR